MASWPDEPAACERLLGRARALTAVMAETCGQQRKKEQQTKDQKRFHDESPTIGSGLGIDDRCRPRRSGVPATSEASFPGSARGSHRQFPSSTPRLPLVFRRRSDSDLICGDAQDGFSPGRPSTSTQSWSGSSMGCRDPPTQPTALRGWSGSVDHATCERSGHADSSPDGAIPTCRRQRHADGRFRTDAHRPHIDADRRRESPTDCPAIDRRRLRHLDSSSLW